MFSIHSVIAIILFHYTSLNSAQNLLRNGGFDNGQLSPWVSPAPAPNGSDLDDNFETTLSNSQSAPYSITDAFPASPFAATIQQSTSAIAGTCYSITFYGFDNNLGQSNDINHQYVTAKFGPTSFGPYNIPHNGNNFQAISFIAFATGNDNLFVSAYNDQYSTNLDSFSIVPCNLPSGGKRPRDVKGKRILNRRNRQLNLVKQVPSSCPKGENLCPVKPGSSLLECYNTDDIEYCGPHCQNCLKLSGAFEVGCVDNSCQIASCEPDYTLIRGMCKPRKTKS